MRNHGTMILGDYRGWISYGNDGCPEVVEGYTDDNRYKKANLETTVWDMYKTASKVTFSPTALASVTMFPNAAKLNTTKVNLYQRNMIKFELKCELEKGIPRSRAMEFLTNPVYFHLDDFNYGLRVFCGIALAGVIYITVAGFNDKLFLLFCPIMLAVFLVMLAPWIFQLGTIRNFNNNIEILKSNEDLRQCFDKETQWDTAAINEAMTEEMSFPYAVVTLISIAQISTIILPLPICLVWFFANKKLREQ